MLQKKEINKRYKPFTKEWLLSLNVDIKLDNVSTKNISTEELNKRFRNYKRAEVWQWSNKFKKWCLRKPIPNSKLHEKGMIGECTYYQVGICEPRKTTIGIPLHRIIYVWFNDIIEPYNENKEKMEVCHIDGISSNNHITNLKYDTAKNNRAERGGAKNQYWRKQNDRNEERSVVERSTTTNI